MNEEFKSILQKGLVLPAVNIKDPEKEKPVEKPKPVVNVKSTQEKIKIPKPAESFTDLASRLENSMTLDGVTPVDNKSVSDKKEVKETR